MATLTRFEQLRWVFWVFYPGWEVYIANDREIRARSLGESWIILGTFEVWAPQIPIVYPFGLAELLGAGRSILIEDVDNSYRLGCYGGKFSTPVCDFPVLNGQTAAELCQILQKARWTRD